MIEKYRYQVFVVVLWGSCGRGAHGLTPTKSLISPPVRRFPRSRLPQHLVLRPPLSSGVPMTSTRGHRDDLDTTLTPERLEGPSRSTSPTPPNSEPEIPLAAPPQPTSTRRALVGATNPPVASLETCDILFGYLAIPRLSANILPESEMVNGTPL